MTSNHNDWFAVDKKGLAQLQARRPKATAIVELISNAWDQNVTSVEISLEPESRGRYRLVVTDDDPNGFSDLSHAFTLFAPSEKKAEPEKRGRFNLGEKLILALCETASIASTTGTILFDPVEGRRKSRARRERGSEFDAVIKMTHTESAETAELIVRLIPPTHVKTVYNDTELTPRTPVHEFTASLPTEIADEEGNLRRTQRRTSIRLFEPLEGETASIYELGIPVVESSGDRWHCDIGQKIPLNMDRDNTTPGFLRQLRTIVMNEMHEHLSQEDVNSTWAKEALSDKRISDEAVQSIVTKRFGEHAVIYDPSDREANNIAVSKGYNLVHGRNLNSEEWANVKRAEALLPAGRITPSPTKLLNDMFSDDGEDITVPVERWTPGMRHVVTYAQYIGEELLSFEPTVRIVSSIQVPAGAFYAQRTLTFNLGRLGHRWFDEPDQLAVDALLIHEFAHHAASNHLDHKFHDECCRLGALLRHVRYSLADFQEEPAA